MVATGAREKMLSFPGNTLPGVYGAGAFQTLVNRDLVKSSERVLIVGGGNVGLIAGYHAIQAGIEVAALIEALPQVGGYKVHADKLMRLGSARSSPATPSSAPPARTAWSRPPSPSSTSNGTSNPAPKNLCRGHGAHRRRPGGGERVLPEGQAVRHGRLPRRRRPGDRRGLGGHVHGQDRGPEDRPVPRRLLRRGPAGVGRQGDRAQVAARHRGAPRAALQGRGRVPGLPLLPGGALQPVHVGLPAARHPHRKRHDHGPALFHRRASPAQAAPAASRSARGLRSRWSTTARTPSTRWSSCPTRSGAKRWRSARRCRSPTWTAPSWAITRWRRSRPARNTPAPSWSTSGSTGRWPSGRSASGSRSNRSNPMAVYEKAPPPDEAIVCRCERITAGEIRAAIRSGVRDLNQLKALTRAGMGACGSKTCRPMIWRMFKEEGVDLGTVTDRVDRPLFVEVPIGAFAGIAEGPHE
ncbi:MAG: NAD(P)/FAD-dependent oxidoreductase [Desulfobacterales bacterium]|nr:NAD(P)/FAD-dependent oxidoreductase [Desulfobacterales bacterium]